MRNTENYNLPLFESGDKFNKETINETNAKIDLAISELQETVNTGGTTLLTTQEVIQARKGKDSLKTIIDEIELKANRNSEQLDSMANKINKNQNYKNISLMNNKSFKNFNYYTDELINTNGVIIDADGNILLDTSSSSVSDHTHVCLFDVNDRSVKSVEFTITEKPNPVNSIRIAFGVDNKNFIFFNIFTGETYLIKNGVLNSSLKKPSIAYKITDVNVGDKIRVNYYNDNMQIYFNDILKDIVLTGSISTIMFDNADKVNAGVSWKNYSNNFKVKNIKLEPQNLKNKVLHLSFDDAFVSLSLITTRTYYTSIFDLPMFAFLKEMHDKYGAVFSLYCYYERGGNDLSFITNKFKTEFENNSDWLKFGFHGVNSTTSFNGTVTDAQVKTYYDNFITQVTRFASEKNIDRVPRLHYYDGTLSNMVTLKGCYKGIVGALSEDNGTDSSYYFDTAMTNACNKFYEVKDYVNNLNYYKTDIRLESFTDPVSILNTRKNDINYLSQMDMLIIFTHEDFLVSGNQSVVNEMMLKIENVCKWAVENNYSFEYPQRYILR